MILGTYHLSNPNLDLNNVKSDDVLAEKRQEEIIELIRLLKKFKPTKIAVEVPFGSVKINQIYADYLAGRYRLTRDETDQIGFRLAKEMNLQKVYGIDWAKDLDFDKVLASAKARNQQSFLDKLMSEGQTDVEILNRTIKTKTISELLRFLNSDAEVERSHRIYLKLVLCNLNF